MQNIKCFKVHQISTKIHRNRFVRLSFAFIWLAESKTVSIQTIPITNQLQFVEQASEVHRIDYNFAFVNLFASIRHSPGHRTFSSHAPTTIANQKLLAFSY